MRPTETVRCPACGTPIWLDLDEPEEPDGRELEERSEECESCGRVMIITGSLDPTGRPELTIKTGERESY
jgi:phage terminase large subunit GpA-like protein